MRSRVHDQLELLVDQRADRAGAQDWKTHSRHPRDGARSHARQPRTRERSDLYRYDDGCREPGQRARGRSGGERLRDCPPSSQLEIASVSKRACQLERCGGQVSHRHDRKRRFGIRPQDDGSRSAQRRRRRRQSHLHAVVGRQQEARFPSRLPHSKSAAGSTRRTTASWAESRSIPPVAVMAKRSRTIIDATTERASTSVVAAR